MNDFSAASSHPNGGYVVLLLVVMMIPVILYFISKLYPAQPKAPQVQYYITVEPVKPKKVKTPKAARPTRPAQTTPIHRAATPARPRPVAQPVAAQPAPKPVTAQQIIDDAIATLQLLGHKKAEAKSIVSRLVAVKVYTDVQEIITDAYKKV